MREQRVKICKRKAKIKVINEDVPAQRPTFIQSKRDYNWINMEIFDKHICETEKALASASMNQEEGWWWKGVYTLECTCIFASTCAIN